MMNRCIYLFCWLCLACWLKSVSAEEQALLAIPELGEKTLIHSDWYARKANEVKMDGNRLSAVPLDKTGWVTGPCAGHGIDYTFGEPYVSGSRVRLE